jgi:DNA modification methylase
MKRLPKMHTDAKVIIGDSQNMHELSNESVQLVVTSPPYFNAPFDYPDLFKSYDEFLQMMTNSAKELRRVVSSGRIVALVVDDTLIKGKKYPVVADITKIFVEKGFKYRERITWVKPEGYIRISKRSGVILQHPYPMYYYPDNLQESILIFQKGDFNYKSVPSRIKELSTIDKREFQENKWYLSVWRITNVLPNNNRLEKGIAAFPEEIPYRLIKLFSYWGETVLDPFLGSGTTMKVANELQRNSAGYEIDMELKEIIKAKLSIDDSKFIVRRDCKRLRTQLQSRIKREVAKNG